MINEKVLFAVIKTQGIITTLTPLLFHSTGFQLIVLAFTSYNLLVLHVCPSTGLCWETRVSEQLMNPATKEIDVLLRSWLKPKRRTNFGPRLSERPRQVNTNAAARL